MKIKTSDLIDEKLDWAVAKCEEVPVNHPDYNWQIGKFAHQYSTDWEQGGPIIERERIQVFPHNGADDWAGVAKAQRDGYVALIVNDGPTPLIAAMRGYVASKLGDEVEIPEELL